ncbi:MAG: hypothetical protein ABL957_09560 [Parvularculaceae bacterium]
MSVVRLAGDLPPELESELRNETAGETLKWAGRTTGSPEQLEGIAVIAAGAAIALMNAPGILSIVGMLIDFAGRGQIPAGGYGPIGASALAFFAGLALVVLGLRLMSVSRRTVWAITDARLLRVIGGRNACCDWRAADILDVRRLNWDDPIRRALAVTAREGRGDMGLVMTGKADLEAADRALAELTA